MAPDCRCLVLGFVALLLPRQEADAFLQPRPVLLGLRKSTSIMSKRTIMSAAVERRDFVTQLSRGVIGALGAGIATDRATAYEVSEGVLSSALRLVTACSLGAFAGDDTTSICVAFDIF